MSTARKKPGSSRPVRRRRRDAPSRGALAGGLCEEQLWAYALGILDPRERDAVIESVAGDERAWEELENIRHAICASAEPRRASALRRVVSRFLRTLKDAENGITAFATAFIRVPGGLVTACRQAGWKRVALQPVPLGDVAVDHERRGDVSKRVSLRGPAGLRISAVHLPTGCVDMEVCVPSRSAEGWIKVFRLVPSQGGGLDQEFTGVQGRLSEGRALLPDCPDGFLRLSGPEGISLDIFLGSAAVGS